jgi:hypothetical protein
MYRFTVIIGGAERRLSRLGPMVRAHLARDGTIALDAHHPQYGWWGQVTIVQVPGDSLPETYAVRFDHPSLTSPGQATLEEPLTDERIAFAIGHAIGSARR